MKNTKDPVTGRENSVQSLINLIPKSFRLIINPNRRCIEKFVESKSKTLPPRSFILDAGAGPMPYKSFFNHCIYESTDFIDSNNNLTFTCRLDKIPRKKESYNAILSTEVLEHVEDPLNVLKEFNRILKKGGRLFVTVPQEWPIHQEPYNFFYFTRYGLESLLKKSGFKKFKIIPKGGYFWFLSDAIRFNGILSQYKNIFARILRIIEYPFTQIIIPLILFPLDKLDKEKRWTMGYLVEAVK